jgi:pyruvate dehydrogenase E2 component (dihydrolipoamide acetyltransferase)
MAIEVILPKVDMDMSTGRISKWLVAEGADVKKGDALFEIETDKAAMEVESPGTGKLGQISAGEGAEVPIGQVVAWIFAGGESPTTVTKPELQKPEIIMPAPKAAPLEVQGRTAPLSSSGERATPLARRLARDNSIDLNSVAGSGPHGRILSADIEAILAKPVATGPKDASKAEVGAITRIPHDSMRKTIARRLTESKQTVPHFYGYALETARRSEFGSAES